MRATVKLMCSAVICMLVGCKEPQDVCVHSREFCNTSFVALVAYRQELMGRMVSFEGLPRKKGDVYYVYMDLESAQYYDQASAIELQIEALEGVEEELDYLELKRSVFIGVFTRSNGNAWASLKLTKVPGQAAIKIESPPPPPPPPPPQAAD